MKERILKIERDWKFFRNPSSIDRNFSIALSSIFSSPCTREFCTKEISNLFSDMERMKERVLKNEIEIFRLLYLPFFLHWLNGTRVNFARRRRALFRDEEKMKERVLKNEIESFFDCSTFHFFLIDRARVNFARRWVLLRDEENEKESIEKWNRNFSIALSLLFSSPTMHAWILHEGDEYFLEMKRMKERVLKIERDRKF